MAKKTAVSAASLLSDSFSAADLLSENLPRLSYVVEGVVPEGLTLLIATPKIGKSWMVLGIGIDVALGQKTLGGIRTSASPVLYLALEDGKRRLQDRMKSLNVAKPPTRLTFKITAKRDEILGVIREFIERNPDEQPVVILDTLGKVMPTQNRGETLYDRDYRIGTALKNITDEYPGSAIIVVHHTRKADTADFAEASSGTNGLTGSADTIMLLRRSRQDTTGTLHVTSRDAREGEYQVNFGSDGRWTLSGGSLYAASEAARSTAQAGNLGDRSLEVIDAVLNAPEGITAPQLASKLGLSAALARVYLSRAADADRVHKMKRGLYGPFPELVEASSSIITVNFTGLDGTNPRHR